MTNPHVSDRVGQMLSTWPRPLRDRTLLFVDNGAFTKHGAVALNDLLDCYDDLGVDYGLVPDAIGEPHRTDELTLDFATRYIEGTHDWTPVAVAHGDTVEEYRDSYRRHRHLGFDHVALGGLLETPGDRTGRHATARAGLWAVTQGVREISPSGWLFALGCAHRRRHPHFDSMGLAGSDGKGWLFRYDNSDRRDEQLVAELKRLIDRPYKQPTLSEFCRNRPATVRREWYLQREL